MLSKIQLFALFGLLSAAFAPATADQTSSVFLIGHSLVNHNMPTMLEALVQDAGLSYSGGRQIINGANLQWQWNNSHTANAQARTYIYETWHCINSGLPAGCDWDDNDNIPWRERLDQDLSAWQGIADHLNVEFAGPEVSLIPAGQAMALLYDRALAGEVPGIGHAFDLFSDDIHLTDAGNYFVALVMFATIFQQSPEGLTAQISNEWDAPYDLPNAVTALALQALAWEAVQNYLGLADAIFTSRFE